MKKTTFPTDRWTRNERNKTEIREKEWLKTNVDWGDSLIILVRLNKSWISIWSTQFSQFASRFTIVLLCILAFVTIKLARLIKSSISICTTKFSEFASCFTIVLFCILTFILIIGLFTCFALSLFFYLLRFSSFIPRPCKLIILFSNIFRYGIETRSR